MLIKLRPNWYVPERLVTPRSAYPSRREIVAGLAAGVAGCGLRVDGPLVPTDTATGGYDQFFPVPQNKAYTVPERPLTDPIAATQWNNFYEFTTNKSQVHELVGGFSIEPWTVQIDGLCHNPGTYGVEDLMRTLTMEERIYRFRCVETWAMTVPWSGFPLAELIALADPMSSATHVAFVSENRPEEMPGVGVAPGYPWPYHEGLTLDEALNELSFVATGLYGEPMPRQNGAPIRLVVPWKYGYKSIKSVIRVTFVDAQPDTFWSTLVPSEYPFESNVDPEVPHPRWSQATEWLIPGGERVDTLKYNGYGEQVAHLYE